jgi:hypothetical protein
MLDVPKNEQRIRSMITLASAPSEIKDLLDQGMLHENTIFEIFTLDELHWSALSRFVAGLSLGTKKRNELVAMIRDIVARDRKDVQDIIMSEQVQKIVTSEKIDPPQRGERLHRYLRQLRYPSIEEFNRRFQSRLAALDLPDRFRLILPENFERWKFQIIIPFSTAEEFRKNVEELRSIGTHDTFDELMQLRY